MLWAGFQYSTCGDSLFFVFHQFEGVNPPATRTGCEMRGSIARLVGLIACVITTGAGTAAQADTFSDSFNTALNPQIWQTVQGNAAGAPWTISAPDSQGRLQISKPADNDTTTLQSVVQGEVVSRFTLAGDFTITVDFNLLNFPVPSSGETFSALSVDSAFGYFNVVRCNGVYNETSCMLDGHVALSNVSFDTATVGTYKIQRQGDTISGFINDGSGFVLLGQVTDPNLLAPISGIELLAAETPSPRFQDAIDVRYDNFTVTADSITNAPEPSTFAMLAAGAIALLAYACRRRKWAA